MTIRKVIKYPDPILEQETKKVEKFDRALTRILDDMYDTMIAHDGVGLAAPQIGLDYQIAIVDIGDKHGTIELINPVILEESGAEVDMEGCLSFPGLYGDVQRATDVKIQAQNRRGKTFIFEAHGFLARACLHEIDHLHGILFTTKVLKYHKKDVLQEIEQSK